MTRIVATIGICCLLCGCLSTVPVRPKVELDHTMLVIPPVSPLDEDFSQLGKHCWSEAMAITNGRATYGLDLAGLDEVLNKKNLLTSGRINREEILTVAKWAGCKSIAAIRVIDYDSLPPQRIMLELLWVRTDGRVYSRKTLDLDMREPGTRKSFAAYARQRNEVEDVLDRWSGEGLGFVADTGRLSPQIFLRYAAALAMENVIDDLSPLRAEERQLRLAADRADRARKDEIARVKKLEETRRAVLDLERQKEQLRLEFEAAKKRAEIAAIKRKHEGVRSADELARAQEELALRVKKEAEEAEALRKKQLELERRMRRRKLDEAVSAHAKVYYQDAVEKRLQGDMEEAKKSLRRALDLEPNFAWAHYLWAIILYEQKDFNEAAKSFLKVIELREKELVPHAWLRLYLAEMHESAKSDRLATYLKLHKRGVWPEPVMAMFNGTKTVEACLQEAKHHRSTVSEGRRCSAYYYVGEYYLLKGDIALAVSYFKKAVAVDTDWAERDAARIRLGLTAK